ncbi:MAG TPA: DUF58 domain-containing protein [Actinomycetota bacterium]|nr:DUF58 domain-containing protein [Actinomycetota bacterium]
MSSPAVPAAVTGAPGGAAPAQRPGRRGLFIAGRFPAVVLAASVVAATLPGNRWADLLGVNLVLLVALALDVVLATRPDALQAGREVPQVISLDRPATGVLRLHNPSGRRLRAGVDEFAMPSLGVSPRRQWATLGPGEWVSIEELIAPSRRGKATIGPLTVRTTGPLGLGGRQRSLPIVDRIRCYPALPGRRQVELRLDRARMLQSGERSSVLRGGSGEFDALREYHPDDEFRRINWRATARSVKPISNTYREERNQQVLLALDASRMMAGTVAGVPRFEHTLDAGIAVAELAGRVGDHVGMAAFSGDVLAFVGPRAGRTQARRILDQLFDVQPSLDAADYRRAFAVILSRHRRRALLVLLTELADQAAMEGLFQALPVLLSRHLVVIGSVADPAVTEEANLLPATSEDAFRKAAAAGTLAARAATAARLSAMGATVVDRPPADLAGALADQYLTIKSRGKL